MLQKMNQTLEDRVLQALNDCRLYMSHFNSECKRFLAAYDTDRPESWAKYLRDIKGRSRILMSDVQDVVETVIPYLMDMFYGGQNVVTCRALNPEDEQKARLMEEKVNYDIQQGINGFKLLYTFFKDALINKMGIIKYYWLKEKQYKKVNFKNLTPVELSALIANSRYEIQKIKSHVKYQDSIVEVESFYESADADVTYDVTAVEIIDISKPVAENVPPEEFIFDFREKDIRNAFKAHKKKIHKNKLKAEYGLKDEEIEDVITRFWDDTGIIAQRYKDLGGGLFVSDNRKSPFVYIYECYIDDYDDAGTIVPKICTMFGDKIIRVAENNGNAGFVVASPIIVPHRICGKGLAELTIEIQELNSALMRFVMDTIYFNTSGRFIINPYRIDVDSFLNSNKPGGVALTKHDVNPADAIWAMPLSAMPVYVLRMIEYIQMIRENRTGIARYVGGIDPKSLNRTATGIVSIMTAAQQRIKLIGKVFAETGVRELYQAFVDMNIKFYDTEQKIKLGNDWVTIKPEDIDGDFKIIIDIGSSTGVREHKFNQKLQMLQIYGQIAKILGPSTTMVFTIDNLKKIIKSMWEDLGYKESDEFIAQDIQMSNIQPNLQQNIPSIEGGEELEGGGGIGGVAGTEGGTGEGIATQSNIIELLQRFGRIPTA